MQNRNFRNVFTALVNGSTSEMQDCGKTERGRLLNMCVIVFFPPFPRCERECRVALGCPRERRLKRQSQLPHRAPARSKSQAQPSWAEGPGTGPGSSRSPIGLFFQLLSPAQGGPGIMLGVCLEKAEPRLGRMG